MLQRKVRGNDGRHISFVGSRLNEYGAMPVGCNPSLAGRKICHTTDGFNTQDKTPIGQQVSYPDRVIPLGMAGGVKPRSIRNEPDSRNPAFDRNGNTGDFDNKGWMDVDASATAQAIADCYS